MALLAEWSLLKPEVLSLNLDIGKNFFAVDCFLANPRSNRALELILYEQLRRDKAIVTNK